MSSTLYTNPNCDSSGSAQRKKKKSKIFFKELPIPESTVTTNHKDAFHLLYLSFIFQGAALLMPFSTFVFLVDFYQEKFCQLNLLYWAMMAVILCTSLCFAIITTLVSDKVSVTKRLFTGHILFILSLGSFLLFSILTTLGVFDSAPHAVGYIPLFSGFLSGVGSGIVQPSYYGLSSLLPPRYTQALVVGETVSGIIIACFRVGTRLLRPVGSCENYDTVVFIALTVVVMIASVAVLKFIFWHEYTKHWLKPVKDNFLVEYRVLEQNRVNSFEDDESVISGRNSTFVDERRSLSADRNMYSKFNLLLMTVKKKFIIFKKTWELQVTILSAMIITLFLYPTFLTAAYSCEDQLCDWGPIITLCVFTLFDFITRWFTLIRVKYNHLAILIFSLARIMFIPLFAVFIFPISNPVVSFRFGFPFFQIIVAVFGVSNGFFASIPLMIIPTKLTGSDKESGGIIAILTLFVGLALGTILSLPFNETILVKPPTNLTNLCCVSNIGNNTWNLIRNITLSQQCTCAI